MNLAKEIKKSPHALKCGDTTQQAAGSPTTATLLIVDELHSYHPDFAEKCASLKGVVSHG